MMAEADWRAYDDELREVARFIGRGEITIHNPEPAPARPAP